MDPDIKSLLDHQSLFVDRIQNDNNDRAFIEFIQINCYVKSGDKKAVSILGEPKLYHATWRDVTKDAWTLASIAC